MDDIKVFCYGSNMSSKRLKNRCPSARFFSVARLDRYKFLFNKLSTIGAGSGKGNINYTNNIDDNIYGVIFCISKDEESILDQAEGLGNGGYEKEVIDIVTTEGQTIKTIVYKVKDDKYLDDSQIPFSWYKNHCVIGAEEFHLPIKYIEYLKSFKSKEDTNLGRLKTETEIYS